MLQGAWTNLIVCRDIVSLFIQHEFLLLRFQHTRGKVYSAFHIKCRTHVLNRKSPIHIKHCQSWWNKTLIFWDRMTDRGRVPYIQWGHCSDSHLYWSLGLGHTELTSRTRYDRDTPCCVRAKKIALEQITDISKLPASMYILRLHRGLRYIQYISQQEKPQDISIEIQTVNSLCLLYLDSYLLTCRI